MSLTPPENFDAEVKSNPLALSISRIVHGDCPHSSGFTAGDWTNKEEVSWMLKHGWDASECNIKANTMIVNFFMGTGKSRLSRGK
jgi:hypothetical protein